MTKNNIILEFRLKNWMKQETLFKKKSDIELISEKA